MSIIKVDEQSTGGSFASSNEQVGAYGPVPSKIGDLTHMLIMKTNRKYHNYGKWKLNMLDSECVY